MKMPRPKWYIGMKDGKYYPFNSLTEPTSKTHGRAYLYSIGPFRTKRAAIYAATHGDFKDVQTAERLSKNEN